MKLWDLPGHSWSLYATEYFNYMDFITFFLHLKIPIPFENMSWLDLERSRTMALTMNFSDHRSSKVDRERHWAQAQGCTSLEPVICLCFSVTKVIVLDSCQRTQFHKIENKLNEILFFFFFFFNVCLAERVSSYFSLPWSLLWQFSFRCFPKELNFNLLICSGQVCFQLYLF